MSRYIATMRVICMSCPGREPHWARRNVAFNCEEAANAYLGGFIDGRGLDDPDIVDTDTFEVITAEESRRRSARIGN